MLVGNTHPAKFFSALIFSLVFGSEIADREPLPQRIRVVVLNRIQDINDWDTWPNGLSSSG